ncbi:MAG TPA: 1,4-dihydroxy-6-naphthoate synthase [Sphingobacteriaceae bacterium]|nr:1,4-dihydroxy-6-naphthoate synthase [Sphingobacteriaceae bacterium]
MKLTLGFSPCPNDTFIFDALIHQKIDTEGLTFEVSFDDVETLNQKALHQELDVTKLSFHAFAHVSDQYVLLDSGSALGFGAGPLLISKSEIRNPKSEIPHLKIGIPGKLTTANFLLSLAFPEAKNKAEMVFSEIERALLNDDIDLGLIIHENRFTYQDKGLKKIIDLGEYWEEQTASPIPLGGIMIKRSLPEEVKLTVNHLIKKSVKYAFENPKSSLEFIRSYSQEMSEEVMYKHIELYVNNYSVHLGTAGRKAVQMLFDKGAEAGVIPRASKNIFLTKDT